MNATPSVAQSTPFLERTMSITFQDEKLDAVLRKISQQAGFTFSYNSAIIDGSKIINETFINKTVRQILDHLFQGTLQYKARGHYIILTKAEISQAKEPQILTGYVVDESTGERLKDVSIYDPVTLSSAVTDNYGYFEIKLDNPTRDLKLAVNKQNYTDTLVVVPQETGRLLNIPIKFNEEKIAVMADSLSQKLKRFWKKTKLFTRQQTNIANIEDTIYREVQFSLIPFVGTNRGLSGNVINDYSLNLLGGYSLGVRKLEIGGIFNVVRGNVSGVQIAGTVNAVGGRVDGVQLAGIFNANQGRTSGAQLAGVFNFNWDYVEDFSMAGVFNFSRRGSEAVQIAGVTNLNFGDQKRPHLAGLFNFSAGNANTQLAGVYNFSGRDVKGAQVSGLFNFAAKDVKGVQTAGLINFAGKEMRGMQLSGILNFASKVNGTQIGLINIADSVKGLPFGLLSIVMKGYHKFEIAADEIFYTNLAFRTGVPHFYNIITAGVKPATLKHDETFWTFGYGIGTAPKLARNLYLNLDVTSNQIMQGNSFEEMNLLNKFYLGFDVNISKGFSFTAGATLNAYITKTTNDGYWDLFSDYQPDIIYTRSLNHDLDMQMWIGGKVGLRFL